MPTRREVMPNGTTKSYPERTDQSVIDRDKQNMLGEMQNSGLYKDFDLGALAPWPSDPQPQIPSAPDFRHISVTTPILGTQTYGVNTAVPVTDGPVRPANSPVASSAPNSLSADDRLTLARMMFAESAGTPEDYEAIGSVIKNRIGQREFGPTLQDVLRQRNGFQIVEEGGGPKGNSPLWNLSANPDKLSGTNLESWNRALAIANGIADGTIADPTGGATLFFSKAGWDGDSKNAPGGFQKMLDRQTIAPSSYVSQSQRPSKNYFFVEKPRK